MNSDRTVLTDAMWARVEHMLPGKATDPGVFERVFNALSDEFNLEYVFVDGTVVQAYQKAAGAKGGPAARGSAAPETG